MRTRIHIVHDRQPLLADGYGSDVTIRWNDVAATTRDLQTGEPIGTVTPRTETKKAMVHFIKPTTNGFRVYTELAIGDAILDFRDDVTFTGLKNLTFEFGGQSWVQKEVSGKLSQAWDVLFANFRLSRCILVTVKS